MTLEDGEHHDAAIDDSIDDPIRAKQNLAHIRAANLRHDAAGAR